MQDELISVIIPVYNGEQYIDDIVEAINKQTYKNLEILFVNDGSTDKSQELIEEKAAQDARIKLINKENGGVSSARNLGLENVKGEYIAFIDVDDYIFPDYFEYLYSLLVNSDADMSCCGYYKILDTEKIPTFPDDSEVIEFSGKEAMKDLLYRRHITAYPYLKMFRRSTLKQMKFPEDIALGEDTIFNINVLKNINKVIWGSKILYIYMQHSNSATHGAANCNLHSKSWEKHMTDIVRYAETSAPDLIKAANCKCFIYATDICCRIWKTNGQEAEDLKKKLIPYINSVKTQVFKDKESKKLNRLLALIACVNTGLMINSCRLYNWGKGKLGIETRRSV